MKGASASPVGDEYEMRYEARSDQTLRLIPKEAKRLQEGGA
jgi:hypothetical protein